MKNIAYISERYLITVSIIPFIVKSTFSKYENKGLLIGKYRCDSNSFTSIGANQVDDSDSFYGGKTSARSEKLNSKNWCWERIPATEREILRSDYQPILRATCNCDDGKSQDYPADD